jgi:type IV pilus assembly protein PilW
VNRILQKPPFRRQRGLSLVELMVAMLIGLILLFGVTQVYVSSKRSANAQEDLARMQENGRFAMDLITRDLRRAGYWGGNRDPMQILGTPGRDDSADACSAGSDGWARMAQRRVFGLNDTSAGYGCATDYSRGDVLTARYASFEVTEVADLEASRLYLRSTLFGGRIMTGATEGDTDNQIEQIGADEPVARALRANAYYVGTSANVTCARTGGAVPVLRRVSVNQNGNPIVEELVPGVEHLQVQFLEAGSDTYRDAGAVTNWAEVAAVRVWLLMRSECPEPGLNNTTTYVMGDAEYPAAADDFRRQLYVATVALRNW